MNEVKGRGDGETNEVTRIEGTVKEVLPNSASTARSHVAALVATRLARLLRSLTASETT